jgi:hypothetical protein
MLREASRWPASTPSKPISLARAITVERAALSSAQVNTVGFSPFAGSRINPEEMDVNAVTPRLSGRGAQVARPRLCRRLASARNRRRREASPKR